MTERRTQYVYKAPARRGSSEHAEQVALFQWAANIPELETMYATPNAGKRPGSQGAWMVAEGLKKGVPDIHLPVARGGYHSLWIELKHGKNKTTKEQEWWLERLNALGHLAVVAYEFEGAKAAIEAYMKIAP